MNSIRSTVGAPAKLAAATAIGSLGLAAGGTVSALLAVEMTQAPVAAGLPLGLLAAGQAVISVSVARRIERAGRGAGLLLTYALGAAGAAVVILAAVLGSFPLLLGGSFLLGGGNAGVFLARYAAADLGGPGGRGRAIGTVLFATVAGTVLGPVLLVPAGRAAMAAGLPVLTGLYLLALVSFTIAGLIVAGMARGSLAGGGAPAVRAGRAEIAAALRLPRARAALLALGATNLVMVAIMAVTPLFMTGHGHELRLVGFAISLHALCMFVPSPLTGWLADRYGGAAVAAGGAVLLVAAGAGGVLAGHDGGAMVAVLAVLGLGWNGGVVGGSALLAASVPARLRPWSEGIGEAAMGVAAAAGAPAAGVLVALGGFAAVCVAGAVAGAAAIVVSRVGRGAPGASERAHAGVAQ
jgi:hypothetical protein